MAKKDSVAWAVWKFNADTAAWKFLRSSSHFMRKEFRLEEYISDKMLRKAFNVALKQKT